MCFSIWAGFINVNIRQIRQSHFKYHQIVHEITVAWRFDALKLFRETSSRVLHCSGLDSTHRSRISSPTGQRSAAGVSVEQPHRSLHNFVYHSQNVYLLFGKQFFPSLLLILSFVKKNYMPEWEAHAKRYWYCWFFGVYGFI